MTGWRLVFVAAALFNVMVGLAMLFAPTAISGADAIGRSELLASRTAALLILTFGVGYGMVAWEPRDHRGIVVLGIIGKLSLVVMVAIMASRGEVPVSTAALVGGDLLFVLLFAAFLGQTRRHLRR
jgi:predicted acyltransferase